MTGGISEFYETVLGSSYMTILSQYSVGGQAIGPGSYRGPFTISPSKCPVGPCHLTDADIQSEIQAQIADLKLVPPLGSGQFTDQDTMYMIYFPPQVTITGPGADGNSCVDFCGYHWNTVASFGTLLYGVMPDFGNGSGCDKGCGGSNEFGNITSVSSHEFSETITDPDVTLAPPAYPEGWTDPKNGEIGDICNQQQTSVCGYVVQKEWSNGANDCVPSQPLGCDSPLVVNLPGAASKSAWNQFYVVDDDRLFQYKGDFAEIPAAGRWAFPPAAPQPDGSFLMVRHFGSVNHLVQYNPVTKQFVDYGGPPGAIIVTTPSEVMYGNRVYLIAQDTGGYQYNNLWEMKFGGGKGTWFNFGSSQFALSLRAATPSVLFDGSLFFIDIKGELINMWWDGAHWIFLNNGYCGGGHVGAWFVGAPMDNSKVFVACSDFTLRQRWYNGANGKWSWVNHGRPAWYQGGNIVEGYADTRPIALGSGHVFLNAGTTAAGSNSGQILIQLWYTGTGWIWAPAGDPPTTFLTGNVDGDPVYPPNVYSLGRDSHIWDAQWDNKSKFVWIDLGKPDGDR